MEEPSILDYIKSLLTPWKGTPIKFPEVTVEDEITLGGEDETIPAPEAVPLPGEVQQPKPQPTYPPERPLEPVTGALDELVPEPAADTLVEAAPEPAPGPQVVPETIPPSKAGPAPWPWRALAALALALAAQRAFAPPDRSSTQGIVLLLLSVFFVAWAFFRNELQPAPLPTSQPKKDPLTVRGTPLGIGAALAVLTFLTSTGNQFSYTNLSLLGLSLIFLLQAFNQEPLDPWRWLRSIRAFFSRRQWHISLSTWSMLVLAATALVLFFRLYRLDQVPPEMVSDHAEKYLDVRDILSGSPQIFFPRNGGREPLQFYLITALHLFFNANLNHLTLKISTVIIGLLSLPYLYLLGKEIGNRRVALLAFTFAGIAYWTNVVSRAGMRLPFYFVFTAAVLYYLLRGLRTSRREDFILSGMFLGFGVYGYSADRLLPLVVVAAVGIFLLHPQSKGRRWQTVWQTGLLVLISFIVFVPLLRYITQDPQGFSFRMLSRMGSLEQPLPGPAYEVFLDNLWQALKMFSWSNGVVWGVSIPDFPALGIVTGGLFYLGAALLLIRYLSQRHWFDLFLLVSIPLLMLPSILALAFPSENPSLYRTGGAIVPVFLLVAIALDGLMSGLESRLIRPWGVVLAWATFALLLGWSAIQDYDRVFNIYYQQYRLSAWNASEMGEVIRSFSDTIGSPDTAWVMGFPHWVDTRLVAINAGYMDKDYAMFIEQLESTLADTRPKLFLVNPQDQVAIDALPQFYPQGWFQPYKSKVETKDFLMFFVPPAASP